jgi:signal transduction histidine kinase
MALGAVCVALSAVRSGDGSDLARLATDIGQAGVALIATAGLVLAVARWTAHRRSREAPVMAWLAAGVAAVWLGCVPVVLGTLSDDVPGHGVLFPLLQLASVPLLLVTALLLAVRHRLGALDVASHRFLEWVLLAFGVVLTYSCLVAGLGELVGANGPTWLLVASTGVIALLAEPARRIITRVVDHVVYGTRDDPLALVRDVMQRVTSSVDVDALLPELAETIAVSMRLEQVAIDVFIDGAPARLGSWGTPSNGSAELPLHHGGDIVGILTVGWAPGSSLRRRDRLTLDDVAAHLSVAVSWVQLTSALRRTNVAIASSREEERRRLRRDLHDGVGPALTGISLGIRTAIRQLERDGSMADRRGPNELLHRIADEIDNSLVDVKRIVRDLRPTALDDQTLTAALTEFTRRFDGIVAIHLDLPEGDVPLPAAVEIASYRIATEAVTNVVRHAHARNCWIRLATAGPVEIDVSDDGVGLGPHPPPGLGLVAMKERALELGGAFAVYPNHPRGTRVHVAIPATVP